MYRVWIDGQHFEFSDWLKCMDFLQSAWCRYYPIEVAVRNFNVSEMVYLRTVLFRPFFIWEENGEVYSATEFYARKYAKLWNLQPGLLSQSQFFNSGKGDLIFCRNFIMC